MPLLSQDFALTMKNYFLILKIIENLVVMLIY